jgi:FkbM family methyltransferase
MALREQIRKISRLTLGKAARVLGGTPIGLSPVRVRRGLAKGARWTMLPFSSYWRHGESEVDVLAATSFFPALDGLVFWDFGAHFGIHTVGMARQVGLTGQVVAFEPDPAAFIRLKLHVDLNKLSNVKLFEAAVSGKDGIEQLFFPGGQGSAVSHFKFNDADNMSGVASAAVRTIAPDRLVAEGAIRLPDIIKIDVQGHGADAVAGALGAIKKALPIIAFSNHSESERDGVRNLLAPLSYRPRSFDDAACHWEDLTEALLIPEARIARRPDK